MWRVSWRRGKVHMATSWGGRREKFANADVSFSDTVSSVVVTSYSCSVKLFLDSRRLKLKLSYDYDILKTEYQ